jgi:hypothetical protein
MPRPFYQRTDALLGTGASNAVTIITPALATYGVPSGFMTSYTALTTDYNTKLALATAPATRTSVAVEEKNVARDLLRKASAMLAKYCTATSTCTNAMLLALQMNERVIPTPRPVWPTPPTIDVLSVVNRLVTVRVHDPASESRGLPFGCVSANMYSYVGPTPPADPREYFFEGATTRAKTQILFPDSVASGATVWLSACWVSARGQRSMGSTPISFTLQGGALPAAA